MATEAAEVATARFLPKGIRATHEQVAVQCATSRTVVVQANAGSAKTTTLALRAAESWTRGVAPEDILGITCTDSAVEALRAALRRIGVPAAVVARMQLKTFDQMAAGVLREFHVREVPGYIEEEPIVPTLWAAVERVAQEARARRDDHLVLPVIGNADFADDFFRANALLKGSMRDLLSREDQRVTPDYAGSISIDYTQLKVYLGYERLRLQHFAEIPLFWGPGDPTYDLARMLLNHEEVITTQAWPSRVRVLVVDEMHDLNAASFEILKKILLQRNVFFCGVGDIDQVIHERNGADARFMSTEVGMLRPNAQTLPLTQTFRFSQALAHRAGRLAEKRYESGATHETDVIVLGYEKLEQCVAQVVQEVTAWQKRPGAKLGKLAVLIRHGFQSVDLENALLACGAAYAPRGLVSYLQRPEVLFIRGLLAVATGQIQTIDSDDTRAAIMRAMLDFTGSKIEIGDRDDDQEQLLRDAVLTVNATPSFLVDVFFENQVLRNASPDVGRCLRAAVAQCRRGDTFALASVYGALRIETLLKDVYQTGERRAEALGNLKGLERAAAAYGSPTEFFHALNVHERKQRRLKSADALCLATVAEVKGLEFDCVVMPFLQAGQFPADNASWKDERNKFYVGMTRARERLALLCSTAAPSRFIS